MIEERQGNSNTWPPSTYFSETYYTKNPTPPRPVVKMPRSGGGSKGDAGNSRRRLQEPRERLLSNSQGHQPMVLLAQDVRRRQRLCEKMSTIQKFSLASNRLGSDLHTAQPVALYAIGTEHSQTSPTSATLTTFLTGSHRLFYQMD